MASLCRRADLLADLAEELLALSSSSSSSWSSSTNPPSEKIGVRSSCEAVAMKRLRAVSSWASWRCMSLKALASWPSSSSESSGMRLREVAGGHLLGRLLEALDPARERARHEVTRPARRTPARSRRRGRSGGGSARRCARRRRAARVHDHAGHLPLVEQRPRGLAQPPVPGRLGPAGGAPRAGGVLGDLERELGPRGPRWWSPRSRRSGSPACRAIRRAGSPARWSGRRPAARPA